MNKAKPFLFWIISGVVIFVELVILFFCTPQGQTGSSPREVKEALDKQNTRLNELHVKAKGPQGQPTPAARVFDAENSEDIKDLTSKWLPTPQWKQPLENHVALYNQQLPAIASYLTGRSVFLHQPIGDTNDKFNWYDSYARLTAQLLQALNDKGCLVLPAQSSSIVATGEPVVVDFATSDAVRRVAGFYTKGTSLPDASEYPLLTLHYHIVELIALALLDNPATNKETPIAPVKTQHEERAALASVEWKAQLDNSISVVVTLHGPLSAVLATEAALEQIHDGTKPIFVVSGGSLGRKTFMAGDRTGSAEEVVARLTLEVLDFAGEDSGKTARLDIAQPIVPVSALAAPANVPATAPATAATARAPAPGPGAPPGAAGPGPGAALPPGPGAVPPGPQTAPGGPRQ
jgi:hypothetical protein